MHHGTIGARLQIAPSGPDPDCAVGPRSGPDSAGPCQLYQAGVAIRMLRKTSVVHHGTIGARLHRRAPIGPRLHRRAPIRRPDCAVAPIAPSGPDQGEIALSLVALLYKAASSATPAVRMVLGRSARILGGCGAVGGIARAYFVFLGGLKQI